MRVHSPLPTAGSGEFFLTEAGSETEIIYRHGFELPEFAMFTLLENPKAVPIMRDIAKGYEGQIPRLFIGGILGPRGDAYDLNQDITAESAEDYHSVQLNTLKTTGVDFASAQTFNNVPEAVGACRAASKIGVPLSVGLTLDSTCRLKSGPSLAEAITEIDAQTGRDGPDFYMLNCSHPIEYEPALENANWIKRLRGVRPNASKMEKIALCKLGHLEDGNPVELGAQLGDLSNRFPHMDIFGGCCGTGDSHLREIAKALKSRSS